MASLAISDIDNKVLTRYTPDVGKLETRLAWLLFAYDHFDDPLHVNGIPGYGVYVFTRERFKMWKQDKGALSSFVPLPVSEDYKDVVERPVWADPNPIARIPLASRIRGTIHLVSPQTLISLDKDMQNTVAYDRIRVPLLYPYERIIKFKNKKPQHDTVVGNLKAWMYVARSEYWEPMIEDFDNRSMFRAAHLQRPKQLWIGNFYTNKEGR